MSKVVSKEQCPTCRDTGRDNLAVYEDGHKYCFGCAHYEASPDAPADIPPPSSSPAAGVSFFVQGSPQDLETRALSAKTCDFFRYEVGKYRGRTCHIANYYSAPGILAGQKLRFANKEMMAVGSISSAGLFGRQLWKSTKKLPIVVTEGELDALSVGQVFDLKYPVVSIPNGAAGAKSSLKKELQWLSEFREVILCFDQDDAGRQAVLDCVDLFEPGTVRVVRLPVKDANDMLVSGKSRELKNAVWNAEVVRPEAIVTVEDALQEALIKPTMGLSWPWATLTQITYGIQPNSIYTLGAGSGIGKTEFLKDLTLHLSQKHKAKIGAIFLESTPAQLLLRLAGGTIGRRLHVPGDQWNEEEVRQAMRSFSDSVYFYDPRKGYDVESVLQKIRYFVKGLDCKYIILDHLTALAAGMGDDRKELDETMSKLGRLVHELECTIFLVSHLAKPGVGKSYEEGRRVTASAFRGSQSIQYWSSFMIGLERDKLADEPEQRCLTTVRILKDRFSGEADGCTFNLKYNRETGRLDEHVLDLNNEEIFGAIT